MAKKDSPPPLEALLARPLRPALARAFRVHDYLCLGGKLLHVLALLALASLAAQLILDGVQGGSALGGSALAALGLCLLGVLGHGALAYGQSWQARRLALAVTGDMQPRVVEAWLNAPSRRPHSGGQTPLKADQIGQGILMAQQEVRQALDHRLQFRPLALELRVLLPVLLLIGAGVHWPSALTLLVIMPVMIVFMALVGLMLGEKATAEQAALHRMAGSFADKMRCLPTIKALGWEAPMGAALSEQAKTYTQRAFSLIQYAFLNASVLDFFASLSVAIIAVFLGLGHLGLLTMPGFGGVSLTQSLPILVLSVEVFQPFRRVSAAYHLKSKGEAALTLLAQHLQPAQRAKDEHMDKDKGAVRDGFVLPYTHERLSISLPTSGLVAITGPSGAGKSTLLDVLFGLTPAIAGQPPPLAASRTLLDTAAYLSAGDLALRKDPLLADVPKALADPAHLSGGQRLRLALVKALQSPPKVLGLDEPTAKLDAQAAADVRARLTAQARERLLLVATHDPRLIALADQQIKLSLAQEDCRGEGAHNPRPKASLSQRPPWTIAA